MSIVTIKINGPTWVNSDRLESVAPKYVKCQRSKMDNKTPTPKLTNRVLRDKGSAVKFKPSKKSLQNVTILIFLAHLRDYNKKNYILSPKGPSIPSDLPSSQLKPVNYIINGAFIPTEIFLQIF